MQREYIYIWFGHASDYAYGYSTWKVAHRCRGLWNGSLSLYLKFSHQDLVDQMAGFELFTDETSVLHRYKMYKISSLWVYTNDVFFFFPSFSKHRERNIHKKWRICEKNTQSKGRERERKMFGHISCGTDIRKWNMVINTSNFYERISKINSIEFINVNQFVFSFHIKN